MSIFMIMIFVNLNVCGVNPIMFSFVLYLNIVEQYISTLLVHKAKLIHIWKNFSFRQVGNLYQSWRTFPILFLTSFDTIKKTTVFC